MTSSLEGSLTKAKEAPSSDEITLAQLEYIFYLKIGPE